MAGHIQQRGDRTWRLHAFVGRDAKGRKRYASKTVHGTKRDAEQALAAFVTEVNRDRSASAIAEPMTVSEVLANWLDAKANRVAPNTLDRYRVAIKLHIDPVLGRKPVSKLRPHHIEDLYNALLAEGLSGASVRKVHWALRQSLAWAHRRGYTAIVATDSVELPPLGERKVSAPSSDDVRKVIDYLLHTNPDWGTLFAILAWTGCRRGEVCALHWNDVDVDAGNILIRRSVAVVPGGVVERGTKTGDARRIAIGPRTVDLLRAHRERSVASAAACDAILGPDCIWSMHQGACCRRRSCPATVASSSSGTPSVSSLAASMA